MTNGNDAPSNISQEPQVYYAVSPTNRMAVAAFVLALLSLIIPVLGVAGIVLGWVALHNIASGRKATGRGLATAAIVIPLAIYGLWWLIAGILLWVALSAFKDILSLLQLEGIYDIWLFDNLQDRAVMWIISGILSLACAVVVPIQLNRAIARKQPMSRQQTMALIGFFAGFLCLSFASLLGHAVLLWSLLIASLALSCFSIAAHARSVDFAGKIDFTTIRFKRDIIVTPRDATASQLILVVTTWAMLLIVILILWLLVSEAIVWYLGLVTGLAAGIFALVLLPVMLNIDVKLLQSIDLKAAAIATFGPVLALVVAGLLWWVMYLLTLVALIAMGFQRLKRASP